MKRSKRGFTLIELMVVMAIIAVLAVLIIGAINIARQASRNTTRQADAKTFQAALESYYAANKSYPGTLNTAYNVYNNANPLRNTGGSLTSYLTNFPTADPNSSNNRLEYCPTGTTTYNLYVVNEPTADPAALACTVPTSGVTDFSVK